MKKQFMILPIIIMLLLPLALAIETNETQRDVLSSQCYSISPFNYEQLVRCQVDTAAMTANAIISKSTDNVVSEVYRVTIDGVTSTQNKAAGPFFLTFMALFGVFFVAVVSYSGYMFMSAAAFPEKRAEAKDQLKNIVLIGIVIVALSPILSAAYDTSDFINNFIRGQTMNESYFKLDSFSQVNGTGTTQSIERLSYLESTSPLLITGSKYYLVSMQARNLILLLLSAISPIIVLLFFFIPTKEYGKIFVYLFVLELMIPILYMLVFKFSMIVAPGGELASEQMYKITALTSALFLNIALHLVLVLISVFKAAFDTKPRIVQDV